MKQNDYVIINNRAYDPVTGLPVDNAVLQQKTEQEAALSDSAVTRGVHMPSVHANLQRSQTLHRRYVKKPDHATAKAVEAPVPVVVQRHEHVQRFAKPAEAATQATQQQRADRPAETHPVAHRAANRTANQTAAHHKKVAHQRNTERQLHPQSHPAPVKKELKPAHVLKNEAIFEAMNREVQEQKAPRREKRSKASRRWARVTTLASSSLAVIMLAGYFTYLSMPNLSLRVAAVQSGVDASYPGYRPDGYAMSGPVSFRDGEVTLKFAHAGGQGYTIKQQKSSWNSSAVKQYVEAQSDSVSTTTVNGLTVYTYSGNAAWVNGGVFYSLEGDALLSSAQIERIATSM